MGWLRDLVGHPPQDGATAPVPTSEPELDRSARTSSAPPSVAPVGGVDTSNPGRPAVPSEEIEDEEIPTNSLPVVFSILSADSSPEVALIRQHTQKQHGLTRADYSDYSRER